ncbi:MAG: hypothetical protein GX895_06885 [Clostridiales bacterium]|uniref:hypothetical protein n=1 Tax=Clostridium sp. N3C TaxID=1776758 RepID=UPI00092DEC90|nr:hypothetical protein [Clostridium sp. N3C]NLZ48502.1 hypothetical protein [Clostridiales bacterium]SCN22661.1 hypothetical protein N3C_0891 [Clostridium sp. N3C]
MEDITEFEDEELLKLLKNNETEMFTLAEIHKIMLQNNMKHRIKEIRNRIYRLQCDGYLGNEVTSDGIRIYYLIFYPEY